MARFEIEIDDGVPAERVLADWLRDWRRRGARRHGKTLYVHQGASKKTTFDAPSEALVDLQRRLENARGWAIRTIAGS